MMPEKFVLKCTHDSGSVLLCRDRKSFSITATRRKLTRSLRRNFYFQAREWCYKDIKPKIIAEPYLTDESGSELKDYKIFCFNGNPEYVEKSHGLYHAAKSYSGLISIPSGVESMSANSHFTLAETSYTLTPRK